ncbi:hypothetical protein U1Q18_039130 [Sarracenia purpurea var. burkii]
MGRDPPPPFTMISAAMPHFLVEIFDGKNGIGEANRAGAEPPYPPLIWRCSAKTSLRFPPFGFRRVPSFGDRPGTRVLRISKPPREGERKTRADLVTRLNTRKFYRSGSVTRAGWLYSIKRLRCSMRCLPCFGRSDQTCLGGAFL